MCLALDNFCAGLREQWQRSNNLAQASGSHLSESIRKPTQVLRELSLRRRALVLSESPSHLGEEVSPKWESATTPLFPSSSPRLGERSSPERENPLAWARPFCLSEKLGENVLYSIISLYSWVNDMCLVVLLYQSMIWVMLLV